MVQRIQYRRDTSANWQSANPILALGEPGWDSTNKVLKIGDGSTEWNSLTAADSALSDALTTEQTVRADADTALDGRLDAVETALPAKADLVGGVVPTAQMPAISIMERVSVADDAARLALTNPGDVQVGDVAVQADTGTTWLLVGADPSLAASWKAIDQSDAVQSVNGQTGTVVLSKADVGLANVDNTADLAKPISTATQTALDTKAPLASPALTGTPTAPTPPAGDNSTRVANTAFVRGAVSGLAPRTALYLPGASGNYVSTPAHASLDITGDIDLRVSILTLTSTNGSMLAIAASSAVFKFDYFMRSNGSVEIGVNGSNTSSRTVPIPAPFEVRVTRVAATGVIVHYYRASAAVPWTQIGAPVSSPAGPLNSTPSNVLEVGSRFSGTNNPYNGAIRAAEMRDGIDGPIVAEWRGDAPMGPRYRDVTGKIWTINGSAWSWVVG